MNTKNLKKALDTRLYDAENHLAWKVLECCKCGRCSEAKAAIRDGEQLRRYLERMKRGGGESEEETERGGKQGVRIDASEWRQQEIEF